jgi:hypothetical protein
MIRIALLAAGAFLQDFATEEEAIAPARKEAARLAGEKASTAGAVDTEIKVAVEISSAAVEGQRCFVKARVPATAAGRPRIAMDLPFSCSEPLKRFR